MGEDRKNRQGKQAKETDTQRTQREQVKNWTEGTYLSCIIKNDRNDMQLVA